jgi:hypothetical protein
MKANKPQWRFRAACVGSHIARRYGLNVVAETYSGHAQHYGYPMRSVGVEWSWRRNTWFVGWELWRAEAKQPLDAERRP